MLRIFLAPLMVQKLAFVHPVKWLKARRLGLQCSVLRKRNEDLCSLLSFLISQKKLCVFGWVWKQGEKQRLGRLLGASGGAGLAGLAGRGPAAPGLRGLRAAAARVHADGWRGQGQGLRPAAEAAFVE